MKKVLLITLAVMLMFGMVAHADETTAPEYGVTAPLTKEPVERLVPGELNITINGKVIYFAYKTYAENDRTFAHGEKLFSELGYETDYNKETGVLTCVKDGESLEFTKDGAQLKENVIYIPVRASMEALGYTVGWDAEQYLVTIAGDKND